MGSDDTLSSTYPVDTLIIARLFNGLKNRFVSVGSVFVSVPFDALIISRNESRLNFAFLPVPVRFVLPFPSPVPVL